MARAMMKASGMPAPRLRGIFPEIWYDMDRFFEPFELAVPSWPMLWRGKNDAVIPELDVVEHVDSITIEAELPGVDKADLSVTLASGMLTVKGHKKREKEDKDENYYLAERKYGAFERSLRLPETIDYAKVEAKFDRGVLKVTAPKRADANEINRKIDIK